jgi:aspartyl-tRNA(Asn)/glutamyl-tRNA(Gln) amidotransferase subunit A
VRYGYRHEDDRSKEESILFAPTRSAGFGDEVRRRILLGAYTLSAGAMDNYFLKAQSVRRLVQQDFDGAFRVRNPLREGAESLNEAGVDAILAPCALGTAPSLEEVHNVQRAVDGYVNDVLTVPASLAGVPAISLPVDTEQGSVGMQVITQWGDEEMLWRVSEDIERMA